LASWARMYLSSSLRLCVQCSLSYLSRSPSHGDVVSSPALHRTRDRRLVSNSGSSDNRYCVFGGGFTAGPDLLPGNPWTPLWSCCLVILAHSSCFPLVHGTRGPDSGLFSYHHGFARTGFIPRQARECRVWKYLQLPARPPAGLVLQAGFDRVVKFYTDSKRLQLFNRPNAGIWPGPRFYNTRRGLATGAFVAILNNNG
jgi:hypothetical protein